jgi:hypothetical protein
MPRPRKKIQQRQDTHNDSLLEAALTGLGMQRERIEQQILEVERMLRHGSTAKRTAKTAGDGKVTGGRRKMSAAARKRIAAAQKRRWDEYRKKLSAAGKEA